MPIHPKTNLIKLAYCYEKHTEIVLNLWSKYTAEL